MWMTPRSIFLPFLLYSKQYAHSLLELGLTAILNYYLVLILCELLAVLMYIQRQTESKTRAVRGALRFFEARSSAFRHWLVTLFQIVELPPGVEYHVI